MMETQCWLICHLVMIRLTASRGIGKTTHILILKASDRNYQNTVITTIGILTSGYDH